MFKKRMFGYSISEVDSQVEALQEMINLQKKDIEFLKRDNSLLKSTLNALSRDGEKL